MEAPRIEQLTDCRVSSEKASGLGLCLGAPIIEQLTVGFQVRCLQAWGSLVEGEHEGLPSGLCWLAFGDHEGVKSETPTSAKMIPAEGKVIIPART